MPFTLKFIPYHGPIMQKDKINALHFSLLSSADLILPFPQITLANLLVC
jgi:hypothetical protein